MRDENRVPLFEQDLDFLEQAVTLIGRQAARHGRVQRLVAYLGDELGWDCGCFTHNVCFQPGQGVLLSTQPRYKQNLRASAPISIFCRHLLASLPCPAQYLLAAGFALFRPGSAVMVGRLRPHRTSFQTGLFAADNIVKSRQKDKSEQLSGLR